MCCHQAKALPRIILADTSSFSASRHYVLMPGEVAYSIVDPISHVIQNISPHFFSEGSTIETKSH